MLSILDAVERFQLAGRTVLTHRAVDKLDRLPQPARRQTLPNHTESPPFQQRIDAISRDRLVAGPDRQMRGIGKGHHGISSPPAVLADQGKEGKNLQLAKVAAA